MNGILAGGIYQPVTTGTAKESTKLDSIWFFEFYVGVKNHVQCCYLLLALNTG